MQVNNVSAAVVWSEPLVVSVNVVNYWIFYFVENNYELEVSLYICLFNRQAANLEAVESHLRHHIT
jgi:hypothetical protein